MIDVKLREEQQAEKHPGFGSYLECMTRSLLTGVAALGLTFSGTYFAQYLFQVQLPMSTRARIVAPTILSFAAAYVVTVRRTRNCQRARMAAEDNTRI